MKFKKIIAGISAVVVAASALSFSAFTTVAADNVFDDLSQKEITDAMGPGWNVGNQLEATTTGTPDETAWQKTKITKELIQAVKAQGFKSVRIPISYLSYIGEAPNYTINANWLARIKEVVNYCVDEGLYAIINMHGDGYNSVQGGWLLCNAPDEKQPEIKAKYAACWEQIATLFKDYDEHLIFESMNEEFDGVTYGGNVNKTYYSNINAYNQIFVDTVRKTGGNNAKRWILIPGWNTNIELTVGDYGFVLPTDTNRDSSIPADEQRIMVSVHYYDPYGFCGTEKPSETGYTAVWGTDTEKKAIRDQFTRCYVSFVSKGYPVIIGEYGAIDKTYNNPDSTTYRELYVGEVCKAARARGLVPVYWDNGWNGDNGFALFDRATIEVTQQGMIDSIMAAYEGEPEPFEIVEPMAKDQALGLIYSSKNRTTLLSGSADASMAGIVKVRCVFDCASDVAFNQYSNINLLATVAGTDSKNTVQGNSDVTGLTMCTGDLELTKPIKAGDNFTISAYTQSWSDASDYVFLIRCIEFLDASGNVIKTFDKLNKPAPPATTLLPKIVKTVSTRSPKDVKKDKQNAKKLMKKAKISRLTAKSNAKKKIAVSWNKVKKANGYEVQVSANKKFKNSKIVFKKLTTKKKLTIKNKKIKSRKTYYVRIRAYTTYKDKNFKPKKIYSSWIKKLIKVKVK